MLQTELKFSGNVDNMVQGTVSGDPDHYLDLRKCLTDFFIIVLIRIIRGVGALCKYALSECSCYTCIYKNLYWPMLMDVLKQKNSIRDA